MDFSSVGKKLTLIGPFAVSQSRLTGEHCFVCVTAICSFMHLKANLPDFSCALVEKAKQENTRGVGERLETHQI